MKFVQKKLDAQKQRNESVTQQVTSLHGQVTKLSQQLANISSPSPQIIVPHPLTTTSFVDSAHTTTTTTTTTILLGTSTSTVLHLFKSTISYDIKLFLRCANGEGHVLVQAPQTMARRRRKRRPRSSHQAPPTMLVKLASLKDSCPRRWRVWKHQEQDDAGLPGPDEHHPQGHPASH